MRVTFDIPESVASYVDLTDHMYQRKVQELILYDLIFQGRLSFGKAAELLKIGKLQLITDLGRLGLPYFDQSMEEVLEDAVVARRVAEGQQ
ncbi:MAG: UPF0175 family protein [Oscillospiraceae bacterium]|jgi:predicted HTH domain antitoxin|nr:UPF0175 family protein [Oscillospiraceae bacterium]